jgi:hypothetical protein
MKRMAAISMFFIMTIMVYGEWDLRVIDRWKFDETINGTVWHSLVDKDDHLVVAFFRTGLRLITPNKMIAFAPFGQGPNEVENFEAMTFYNDGIAIFERLEKAKIFTKKEGSYAMKEILWFKRGGIFSFLTTAALFIDNKWFLAGLGNLERKGKISQYYCLNVFDNNRKPMKKLLTFKRPDQDDYYHLIRHHCASFNDLVFILKANTLKMAVISSKDAEVVKEVTLEPPSFYKKMPENYYLHKDNHMDQPRQLLLDLENWQTTYSRITRAVVDGNYLVLSVRTCSKNHKRFALLFYNAKTYKLEKVLFTDDFLLAAKNNKYYFYANGEPTLDENTDKCIINVYKLITTQ